MKTIDIIGTFSAADKPTITNPVPVLYKIIESAVVGELSIRHIYLFNGDIKNEFNESYKIILKSLKNNYKEYDFSCIDLDKIYCLDNIEDVKKIEQGVILFNKENNVLPVPISFYFDFFKDVTVNSDCDCLYYNLQSGNIQSREAIQICLQYYANKEKYIYNESYKNEGEKHENEVQLLGFCKKKNDMNDIATDEEIHNIIDNRIDLKKDINETIELFHNNIIKTDFENGKYFEAYYHYLNNKEIFNSNYDEILNSCFKNNVKIKYIMSNNQNIGYIKIKELANYFLYRLFYLKSKIDQNQINRKVYSNIEKLLFILYHLEKSKDVKKKECFFEISKDNKKDIINYMERIDKFFEDKKRNYNNGPRLSQLDIDGIDIKLLEKLNKISKSDRHNSNKDIINNRIEIVQKLFKQLVEKYDSQYSAINEKYCSIKFEVAFKKIIEDLKNNLKVDLKKLVKVKNKDITKDKVCILAMCGSTEPINMKDEENFHLGSTLSLMYAINYVTPNDNSKDIHKLLNQLKNINNNEKIPLYYMMSKESINAFFNPILSDSFKNIDELNSVYKTDVHIIPFAKNEINEELNYEKNLDFISKDIASLLNLKSYGDDGYNITLCWNFVYKIVEMLLRKYDKIYIMESSGIPSCKMALSFMSLMYPSKIVPLTMTNPNLGKKSKNTFELNDAIICNNGAAFRPLNGSDNIVTSIENHDCECSNIISYLIQDIKFETEDDLKVVITTNNLDCQIDEILKHDSRDSTSREVETLARRLCQSFYQSKFGFNTDSVKYLDKVFEYVFGISLKEKIKENNLIINEKNLVKHAKAFNLYNNCKIKIDSDNKMNLNQYQTDRLHGIENAFVFASNYNKNLFEQIIKINEYWKEASDLKHNKTSTDFGVDLEIINSIIKFDSELKKSFEIEYEYYQKLLKCYPYLINLNMSD